MRTDLAPILAAHPGLQHRMRFVRMRFQLRSSSQILQVDVDGPRLAAKLLPPGEQADSDFTIAADTEAWAEFARDMPPPGYQDLIAMVESGHASFSGDGLPFYRNLFLVKAIVAAVFRGDASW